MDLSKFAAPATQVAPATTPTTNPAVNPLAAKLASLNASLSATKTAAATLATTPAATVESALLATKAALAPAEATKLATTSTEVPADIYTLAPAIHEIQGFQAEQFSTCLASTYRALHADQPNLATLLEAINKNLRQYEELSYLLTEPQLNLYFQGLMKVTGTKIAAKPAKKSDANLQLAIAKQGGQLDLSAM